jgi:hypothetical protein
VEGHANSGHLVSGYNVIRSWFGYDESTLRTVLRLSQAGFPCY